MKRPQLSTALRAILDDSAPNEPAYADEPRAAASITPRYWLRVRRRRGDPERAACDELERVHALELGYLLREAARLRAAVEPGGRRWRWLVGRPGTLGAWRRAFREALRLVADERCATSRDLDELCRRCLAADVADWPPSRTLFDASLALAPHELGRLACAGAALAAGDFDGARRIAARELDPRLPPREEGAFWAALACSEEASGRLEAALECHATALERFGEQADSATTKLDARSFVAAHLLYLALALGRREHAARAAAELATLTARRDFDARAFELHARDLQCATSERRAEQSFGVHPNVQRDYLRFTTGPVVHVRRVAVALC
ncbi:MAG: hypothetical protein L6Q99_09975 [Planctomycetes bacterium]|nr:hypothetical protein [Planctomycetota bacterium]